MIACISGKILAKSFDSVVVETGGIGYLVNVSARSLSRLPEVGESTQLLTQLVVREDSLLLYGFLSQEEQELFECLTSVSGVGPKVALSVLGTFEVDALMTALASQDVVAIQKVPGVGKKMASRIVLELKDAFTGQAESQPSSTRDASTVALPLATEALLAMGFSSKEAHLALKGAPETSDETVLLQYALKRLGN